MSSNWSCILFEKNIVIHCEESNAAFQHFYPIPLLRKYKWKMANESSTPFLYGRLPPARTLSKKFAFPKLTAPPVVINHMHFEGDPNGFGGFANAILTPGGLLLPLPPDIAANLDAGLADGGAVDLAQLLTAQQLEQLFAQAPLFALIPPGQNPQLLVQAGLEQGAPLPAQLAANLGHPAGSATQPANGAALTQADAAGPGGQITINVDYTNMSEDAEDDEDDGEEPNQGNEQGNNYFSNPFPFPWYPESAHFVRQWWPTLPGVPRVSCTVVLLAAHDPQTHATRFVLAQHYFRVPLDWKSWKESQPMAVCAGNHQEKGKRKQKRKRRDVNGKAHCGDRKLKTEDHRSPTPLSNGTLNEDLGEGSSSPRQLTSDTYDTDYDLSSEDEAECECGWAGERYDNMSEEDDNDNSMKMWYVSTPFDVVCVSDVDEEEDGQQVERPRPLIAVDFGHAVWIEDGREQSEDRDSVTLGSEDEDEPYQENIGSSAGAANPQQQGEGSAPRVQADPKRLRFVTFPPYDASSPGPSPSEGKMEGVVRTLKVPDDLDLDNVETINIDQSQGAVILSVRDGKIFILCYE